MASVRSVAVQLQLLEESGHIGIGFKGSGNGSGCERKAESHQDGRDKTIHLSSPFEGFIVQLFGVALSSSQRRLRDGQPFVSAGKVTKNLGHKIFWTVTNSNWQMIAAIVHGAHVWLDV